MKKSNFTFTDRKMFEVMFEIWFELVKFRLCMTRLKKLFKCEGKQKHQLCAMSKNKE